MIFNKKKKEEPKQVANNNYSNWTDDLGFLTLIMTRKKNITKNYFISVYGDQLSATEYIRDEDIEDIIISGVQEVVEELAPNYTKYLTEKYFGTSDGLIKFITEDFFVDLSNAAIDKNRAKVIKNLTNERFKAVMAANSKRDKEEDE